MRFALFVLLFLFIAVNCAAQQLAYKAFTVTDGLPSNCVYRVIEDDKGFLWVATDAGIARFDGKHFQVFTYKDGVPDNEVLAVVKENNGRIWINCFKQSPAYFDEVQNRFINAKDDSTLAKIKESTGNIYCYPLQAGGVMFVNEEGSFILRDEKLTVYYIGNHGDGLLVKENKDGTVLKFGNYSFDAAKRIYQARIYQVKADGYIDSLDIQEHYMFNYIKTAVDDGKLYAFLPVGKKCLIYSCFNTHPIRFMLDSVSVPEPFNNFAFTFSSVYLLGNSGKIYVFDKKTLKQQPTIWGSYLPNSYYDDKQGNKWVCTIDKGLLLYRKKQFNNIPMPSNFNSTNFLSIARKQDGTLLAGNYYGEVLENKGNLFAIKSTPNEGKLIFRQRKIELSQNKVFTFSESGTFANYNRAVVPPKSTFLYTKTAMAYNDSIIIVGQVGWMQKLNTVTEKVTLLYKTNKRVTALAKTQGGVIYYGSTDGLYAYDYINSTGRELNQKNVLLRERVTGLCVTADNIVWVATSGNGVLAVKDDKVILHVAEKEGIINNSTRTIATGRPGQVWLGTVGGLSVINYTLRGDKISYAIQNLSVNDGLTNNVINEMLYDNDTVFAATADGISVIPANISIPQFNIPVQLVRVSINQRDTIVAKKYTLAYDQQNIQVQFAGIELSGHFKNIQYTLDGNKNWITLDENILTLRLNSGNHVVQVRAVDVNNNISDKILVLRFNIATPFWKDIWFWVMSTLGLQLIAFFAVSQWLKKKREAKLAKEIATEQTAALEQQAFTSLMNPHFLFNALNSIQHYINMQDRQNANRYLSDFASLIRKNFEAAQQSFIPLEQELENIKIYLRLEQMRFNGHFIYKVDVSQELVVEDWMVPTMMLQPFLENALLHGIMPSSIDGKLDISFDMQDNNLAITITDNGIGMANSQALQQNNGHKSRGMQLIEKRIAALSHFGVQPITIHISPAFEDGKNPGNTITLVIPDGLFKAWLQAKQA